MAEKALVLSADPWEMTDEKSGEIRKGVSFWYVNSYRDGDNGLKPTKVSVLAEVAEKVFGKLPAVCDLDYGSRPGAQNKATLTVIGCELVKSLDLASLFNVKPAPAARS